MQLTQKQAILILNGLPGLGPVTQQRLLEMFDDEPAAIFSANEKSLRSVSRIGRETVNVILNWQDHFSLQREEARLEQGGVSFVTYQEKGYPPMLREIYDPPIGLYAKGDYRPGMKTVAIVGSRRTTLYGQKVAKRLGSELARLGFCIVSGLARGIDTAAHEGALEVDGKTAAVLGCGVDIVYPPENVGLYKTISEKGVVFSEFPLGMRANKTTFPMRNRIVSGMSQAIIVVESDRNGGSMITARMGIEHNRHVFAVPGRIDQATSHGCHQLIRDGSAALFTSVDDFLEEVVGYKATQPELDLEGDEQPRDGVKEGDWKEGLNDDERTVMECFIDGSILNIDGVMEKTGFSVQSVSATLLMLELKKRLGKRVDGTFEMR